MIQEEARSSFSGPFFMGIKRKAAKMILPRVVAPLHCLPSPVPAAGMNPLPREKPEVQSACAHYGPSGRWWGREQPLTKPVPEDMNLSFQPCPDLADSLAKVCSNAGGCSNFGVTLSLFTCVLGIPVCEMKTSSKTPSSEQ